MRDNKNDKNMLKAQKQLRYRRWCLTINNYGDQHVQELYDCPASYIIVGREVGKKNNTPHLQIYMEFPNAKTFSAIKKIFDKAHIEVSKGNAKQNTDYCSKEHNVILQQGEPFNQGKRNDLNTIKQHIHDGYTMREMIDQENIKSLQGMRMAECLMKYIEPARTQAPKIIWRYGKAGVGKSRWVYENYTEVFSPINFKWWEGYDAHKTVLIDDLRGDFCKYHEFLKLIDRYPYRVECKGNSRQLIADTIIITSPLHPTEVWNTIEDKKQLLRRITEIHHVHKNYTEVEEGNTNHLLDYTSNESEDEI